MKKIIIVGTVVLVLIVGVIVDLKFFNQPEPEPIDFKNGAYLINDQIVALKDGLSEVDIVPGAASKNITRYFGNEVKGDFNSDGLEDIAFLLTQDNGGSGTFFYVVGALREVDGFRGLNGVLLGDRIAPQTTEFRNGEIIVNYADRQPDEPMTATSSVGVSRYFKVSDGRLIEIKK